MPSKSADNQNWTKVIRSKKGLFDFNFKEVWQYRDLLLLFVRRDFVSVYKQTILGPVWFFLQPIVQTIVFTFIFGRIGKLGPEGFPTVLFYLSGITMWGYFSESLTKTSVSFFTFSNVMGKVYFPRLIVPLSIIVSSLLKFGVQLILLIVTYFYFFSHPAVQPNMAAFLFPILIILMAMISLGLGVIIASLSVKYRDLKHVVGFGVQLLMYFSPVIFSMDKVPNNFLRTIIKLNPMTGIIETFRYGFFGTGSFDMFAFGYSILFAIVVFFAGILMFNKVEGSFADTV